MNTIIILALLVLSVICVTKGDDYDDSDVNRIENMNQPISADKASINVRLRRASFLGAFKENSHKKHQYQRQSLRHSLRTDPEGGLSMDTHHQHEKGRSSERTNKAGFFRGNTNDNQWFDGDF